VQKMKLPDATLSDNSNVWMDRRGFLPETKRGTVRKHKHQEPKRKTRRRTIRREVRRELPEETRRRTPNRHNSKQKKRYLCPKRQQESSMLPKTTEDFSFTRQHLDFRRISFKRDDVLLRRKSRLPASPMLNRIIPLLRRNQLFPLLATGDSICHDLDFGVGIRICLLMILSN